METIATKFMANHDLENAIFYAELNLDLNPSKEADLLFSNCLLKLNRFKQLLLFSKGKKELKHVYSIACFNLNEFNECLFNTTSPSLKAKCLLKLSRHHDAIQCFLQAVELDPFDYCSFRSLAELAIDLPLHLLSSPITPLLIATNKPATRSTRSTLRSTTTIPSNNKPSTPINPAIADLSRIISILLNCHLQLAKNLPIHKTLATLPLPYQSKKYPMLLKAKSYYESNQFLESREIFSQIFNNLNNIDGIDFYSAVLWHLDLKNDLDWIATWAVSHDRLDKQSWYYLII